MGMNKPQLRANDLLNNLGIDELMDISLTGLVRLRGAEIQNKKINGAQGRIIISGGSAMITINSEVTYEKQKRFIIAHELGHYELHRHLKIFYNCDEPAFYEWHKKGSHEKEANEFAGELLMPSKVFYKHCQNKLFDLNLIFELSDRFQTTPTSTAIKYVQNGHFPIFIVCSYKGRVKWYKHSSDFPYKFLLPNIDSDVPKDTVAGEYFYEGKRYNEPEIVFADNWFKDFNMNIHDKFFEQCIISPKKEFVLSIIWGE